MSRSWDVFCRVIDHYGDAAACWRLARQLAAEHGAQVRLWIDALDALHALFPEVVRDRESQSVAGVDIRHWCAASDFGLLADIAVDAFGGGLPDAYVAAMARRVPPSLWIILEYLSAEPWVVRHHGLPSPHPRLPIARHFFFPGVVQGTGGVLKEASLEARRDAFQRDRARQAGFWRDLGFAPPDQGSIAVSLFGYENPAVAELMHAWAGSARQVVAAVPPSSLRSQASAFFGVADPDDGSTLRRGSLEARWVPFLPQPGYDELLWACDWNFVRGEDSFVRAQWALRPFVWHIYAQQERAHWAKLDAFLEVYCAGLEPSPREALRSLWHGWNEPATPSGRIGAAWQSLDRHQERLREHARAWAARLALPGDLAANLAHFCEDRLK
jgi:uncharacterized repeat protein (TIGR03837 family)